MIGFKGSGTLDGVLDMVDRELLKNSTSCEQAPWDLLRPHCLHVAERADASKGGIIKSLLGPRVRPAPGSAASTKIKSWHLAFAAVS